MRNVVILRGRPSRFVYIVWRSFLLFFGLTAAQLFRPGLWCAFLRLRICTSAYFTFRFPALLAGFVFLLFSKIFRCSCPFPTAHLGPVLAAAAMSPVSGFGFSCFYRSRCRVPMLSPQYNQRFKRTCELRAFPKAVALWC